MEGNVVAQTCPWTANRRRSSSARGIRPRKRIRRMRFSSTREATLVCRCSAHSRPRPGGRVDQINDRSRSIPECSPSSPASSISASRHCTLGHGASGCHLLGSTGMAASYSSQLWAVVGARSNFGAMQDGNSEEPYSRRSTGESNRLGHPAWTAIDCSWSSMRHLGFLRTRFRLLRMDACPRGCCLPVWINELLNGRLTSGCTGRPLVSRKRYPR